MATITDQKRRICPGCQKPIRRNNRRSKHKKCMTFDERMQEKHEDNQFVIRLTLGAVEWQRTLSTVKFKTLDGLINWFLQRAGECGRRTGYFEVETDLQGYGTTLLRQLYGLPRKVLDEILELVKKNYDANHELFFDACWKDEFPKKHEEARQ